jgi:hypothetical protein
MATELDQRRIQAGEEGAAAQAGEEGARYAYA